MLTFTQQHGLTDLDDATLAAEKLALGRKIAAASDNAALGMVRLESFHGYYKNGDTVPLPVSPVDGYAYSRDELIYVWGVRNTSDCSQGLSGWMSGRDSIWYCAFLVDQATGAVSTDVGYRRSGHNANPTVTSDGLLSVVTIAQRGFTTLAFAKIARRADLDTTLIGIDKPLTQSLAQSLNDRSKYSVVSGEVIYMGEFYNGQTVPQPVSPVDGYTYPYDEVSFQFSWRWTTTNSAFSQPGMSLGQMGPMFASISATGGVSCSVDYIDDNDNLTNNTGHGRIAVFAIAQRRNLYYNCDFTDQSVLPPVGWSWSDPITHTPGSSVPLAYVTGAPTPSGKALQFTYGVGDAAKILCSDRFIPANAGDHYTINAKMKKVSGPSTGFVTAVVYDSLGSPIQSVQVGPCTSTSWTDMASSSMTVAALGTGPYRIVLYILSTADSAVFQVTEPRLVRTVSSGRSGGGAFSEISDSFFMPGQTLRSSTVATIGTNLDESVNTPEVFGPTTYHNGDTVPTPVSPIDGYVYSYPECRFIYEWSSTANQTGAHLRLPIFFGNVDDSNGAVTLAPFRLPPGGPVILDNQTLCTVRVTVIAHREASLPAIASTDPVPPPDLGTVTTDAPDAPITVDGS